MNYPTQQYTTLHYTTVHCTAPCDWSLAAQLISFRKAQSRKKKPTYLCALREFPQKCLPCLIIMQSCYCDYRINKTLSPLDLRSLLCSRDLDVLRTQRIIGFYLNYPQINELGESDHSNYILCYVMLCYALLCCAVLCYAMLCYTILPYGTVLYCTALRCAVLYCAVLYCALLCCAALCCAVLYCAVLCCAALCCATLCCIVLCAVLH